MCVLLVGCSFFFPFGMWFYLFGLVGLLYCFLRKDLNLNELGESEDVKGPGENMIKLKIF